VKLTTWINAPTKLPKRLVVGYGHPVYLSLIRSTLLRSYDPRDRFVLDGDALERDVTAHLASAHTHRRLVVWTNPPIERYEAFVRTWKAVDRPGLTVAFLDVPDPHEGLLRMLRAKATFIDAHEQTADESAKVMSALAGIDAPSLTPIVESVGTSPAHILSLARQISALERPVTAEDLATLAAHHPRSWHRSVIERRPAEAWRAVETMSADDAYRAIGALDYDYRLLVKERDSDVTYAWTNQTRRRQAIDYTPGQLRHNRDALISAYRLRLKNKKAALIDLMLRWDS